MRLAFPSSIRVVFAVSILAIMAIAMPGGWPSPFGSQPAFADEEPPPPPPLPDEEDDAGPADAGPDTAEPPKDADGAAPPSEKDVEIDPLQPGEAVVTRFSQTVEEPDSEGQPVKRIDINGTSASILDIRRPGEPAAGQHWIDEPQRLTVSAGEVGQVFGVALGPRDGNKSPDIYLSATAAFGLHRTGKAPGKTEWMEGMWGPDSGPGSIFLVGEETGFLAEKFADVKLDGRANTGAALGNIAYDQWHGMLFVSDLETGMIHSLDAKTGEDNGHYDHGVVGRVDFLDSWTGKKQSLQPVDFDPATSADITNCPGEFTTAPECWNIADFRRRVWGLNVRRGADGEVRLFYSIWGSDAFGNADWAGAGDDRRNSVWSVAIDEDGLFDEKTVRREFFMAAFWPSLPAMGDKAGNSNAVSDIAFPQCGPNDVMLVSERGALRNLGLDKTEAFSRPYESRVLRYERGADGAWRPSGRYDVGFHDRSIRDGDPLVFSSAAGGADFSYGLTGDGALDSSKPSQSVWMTGDGLCSPDGPCTSTATGEHDDDSQVHGLQGSPADAFGAIEPNGKQDTGGLDRSYMIDTDINIGNDGAVIADERMRNDATRIGDVAIYQVCEGAKPLTEIDVPAEVLPPGEPPEDYPVHELEMSHEKWASTGHRVQRSWHRREGSWHSVDRSWHWKSQSYHSRSQSWHWRGVSAHGKDRSWHRKGLSLHDKRYSWHGRDRSWHLKVRSYHDKIRSWNGGHNRGKSYHVKSRTWSGEHNKGRSYHVKSRTWSGQHIRGRSYHNKAKSWNNDRPQHVKARSYHNRNTSWGNDRPGHVTGRSYHDRGKTWGGGKPDHNKAQSRNDGGGNGNHVKGRSYHDRGKTWGGGKPDHDKAKSRNDGGGNGNHVKGRTYHDRGKTWGGGKPDHDKAQSRNDDGGKGDHVKGRSYHNKGTTWGGDGKPKHLKQKSDADNRPKHAKNQSVADKRPKHDKQKSDADNRPKHAKNQSKADEKPKHDKLKSDADNKPKHSKKQSRAANQPDQGNQQDQPADRQQHNKRKSAADQGGDNQQGGDTQQTAKKKKKKLVHDVNTSQMVEPR